MCMQNYLSWHCVACDASYTTRTTTKRTQRQWDWWRRWRRWRSNRWNIQRQDEWRDKSLEFNLFVSRFVAFLRVSFAHRWILIRLLRQVKHVATNRFVRFISFVACSFISFSIFFSSSFLLEIYFLFHFQFFFSSLVFVFFLTWSDDSQSTHPVSCNIISLVLVFT